MDCARDYADHSSIGTSNHVALGDIGRHSLRVLYGRPRAASHLSLFRSTIRLIASRRGGRPLPSAHQTHREAGFSLAAIWRYLRGFTRDGRTLGLRKAQRVARKRLTSDFVLQRRESKRERP